MVFMNNLLYLITYKFCCLNCCKFKYTMTLLCGSRGDISDGGSGLLIGIFTAFLAPMIILFLSELFVYKTDFSIKRILGFSLAIISVSLLLTK